MLFVLHSLDQSGQLFMSNRNLQKHFLRGSLMSTISAKVLNNLPGYLLYAMCFKICLQNERKTTHSRCYEYSATAMYWETIYTLGYISQVCRSVWNPRSLFALTLLVFWSVPACWMDDLEIPALSILNDGSHWKRCSFSQHLDYASWAPVMNKSWFLESPLQIEFTT